MPDQASTAIRDVRVFDGQGLTEPRTVTFADGVICADDSSGGGEVEVVDGRGGTLLPGLIDTHVHADTLAHLEAAATWGVTTLLDMGGKDHRAVAALAQGRVLPDLRSAGNPASAPGSQFVKKMGFDISTAVTGTDDAARFVADRQAEESDYVKILIEDPKIPGTKALEPPTVAALVDAAHDAGLMTVGHVVSADTMMIALRSGVDVITHTALTTDLGPDFDAELAQRPVVLVPTLTMMNGVVQSIGSKPMMRLLRPFVAAVRLDYKHAESTVATFHRAGVVILAGTDSNDDPGAPYQVPHGESLHEELERLVRAGLTPAEALRGATSLAADTFGLADRGVVAPGRRADLLLVDGDPTTDITSTRNVRDVWIGGVRPSSG